MSSRLVIESPDESIILGSDNIMSVSYESDTPDDSNARASDIGASLIVKGKIITTVSGEEADDTRKLAIWSLVKSEKADAYRDAVLEIIAADSVVRKIHFPHAFVVDYIEDFDHAEGTGKFELVIRQKKDKIEDVSIEGGYAAE
ncbi:membrane-associated protease 1 [Natronospora cellulosivora (SeqCode)]